METSTPTSTPTGNEVQASRVSQNPAEGALERLQAREGTTGEGKAPEEGTQAPEEGAATPEEGAQAPEEGDQGEETNDQFVQSVKIGEKEVPVNELLKDAKFTIPVGDEDYEFQGTEELMKFAGIGIHASQRIRQAKDVIEEANQLVKASEAKVSELQASVEKMADEKATKILDDLFINIQKGIDPRTGQPFTNEGLKGAMERSVQVARGIHSDKPSQQPENTKSLEELVRAELDKRSQAQEAAARNERIMAQTQDLFQKETAPFAQKFLKADGKTVNTRIFNSFRNDVVSRAVELVQGKRINAAEGQRIIKAAIKDVLPDYEEFFAKPTKTVQAKPGAPLVRPQGGTQRGTQAKPEPAPRSGFGESLGDFWDRRFANRKR